MSVVDVPGLDLEGHTPESVAVLERHLGGDLNGGVGFDTLRAANLAGDLVDVLADLDTTPGGSDLAWCISSVLEEGPR